MSTSPKIDPRAQHLTGRELTEEVASFFDRYNTTRPHRALDGGVPVDEFRRSGIPVRRLPERIVATALMPRAEGKTVQKAGIQHGRFYRHHRLNNIVGRQVTIAYSDRDQSFVHVYLEGEYLCKAVAEPTRAMAAALVRSRDRQIETINRAQVGAERLRLERAGLDADDLDLEALRRERKPRRRGTDRKTAATDEALLRKRARHLQDADTWLD